MTRSDAVLVTGLAALLVLGPSTAPGPAPPTAAGSVRHDPAPARAAEPVHPAVPFLGYTVRPVPRDGTAVRVSIVTPGPSTVATDQCPYTFRVIGLISVDRGPVDVAYEWRLFRGDTPTPAVVHFAGRGTQSVTVLASATVVGFDTDITVELSIVGGGTTHRTMHLTCGAAPSLPVAAYTGGPCPYATAFTATLVAAYPQNVTYEWRTDGGIVRDGVVHVNAGQPVTVTLPGVVVWTGNAIRPYPVTLRVTSPGGGVATGVATCGRIRH